VQRVSSGKAACSLEIQDRPANRDADRAARHFLDRVLNTAMAIRRQHLQNLQQHGATQNDQAHEKSVMRIGNTEQRAENSKRGEMFQTG